MIASQSCARVSDEACIWVSAGVLAYKLCDRGFDCEHCPLYAALHGAAGRETWGEPVAGFPEFPDDRMFSDGHTWLLPLDRVRCRFGLDGFASSLLGAPRRIVWRATGPVGAGEPLCELDFPDGPLGLSIPVPARVRCRNQAVADTPAALAESPYGAGWIAEVALCSPLDPHRLLSSEEARRQARLDARHFCRAAGFQLLLGGGASDPAGAIVDLRRVLGPERFITLARELVH